MTRELRESTPEAQIFWRLGGFALCSQVSQISPYASDSVSHEKHYSWRR